MTKSNINTCAQLLDSLSKGYYKNNTRLVDQTCKQIEILETVHEIMSIRNKTKDILRRVNKAI